VLNGKEAPFDLLQDSRIVINHSAVEANLNWCIRYQQVLALVAIEIFDSTFFVAVTAAEITLSFPHRSSLFGNHFFM